MRGEGVHEVSVALLPGDGIGPEVIAEGIRVLKTSADLHGFSLRLTEYPWSGDHFLKTGVLMPDSALDEYRRQDAIYLGAIGDPRLPIGQIERAVVGAIRFRLDLYVNLRPIRCLADHLSPLKAKGPKEIDFVVCRENTEDCYTGIGGFLKKGGADEVAIQEMVYTRKGTERIVRYAFDLAKRRPRHKLTLVDKANAIPAHDLWRRTFAEVGKEYPEVQTEVAYVDAACMWMVKNPEWFDVIVTPNLFGDILTDLGAILQGGMGVAASGNLHPGRVSMFEPIHGSAPKYRGLNTANPIAAIAAAAMMLEHLGEPQASSEIESAITRLLASRRIPSVGTDSGLSTSRIGDLIVSELGSAQAAKA